MICRISVVCITFCLCGQDIAYITQVYNLGGVFYPDYGLCAMLPLNYYMFLLFRGKSDDVCMKDIDTSDYLEFGGNEILYRRTS